MAKELNIEPCEKEHLTTIVEGINAYNLSMAPAVASTWTSLEFVVKNEVGTAIAGILAGIGYWNGLEIRIIWVDESYRNNGLGTSLLSHVEQIAAAKGATISMLDTFDFQAAGFYLKNGYQSIGEIDNFPKGHKRIYFSKVLNA